jgi:mycothiol synthase
VVELALGASGRSQSADPAAALLASAVEEVARRGGGQLRYWVARAGPADDARAGALGFVQERDLLQLRVGLPLDKGVRRATPLPVRAFVPGEDENAWLAANNRAFAGHPEQGGWEPAAIAERVAEPWFDPAGFLLYEEDGRLAGSCWTKVHADTDPPMGEIYVISVDPDFHGRGLGKALTVAGLDHLADVGLRTGMLYVDADNTVGTSLYLSLGFVLDHIDRAYTLEVRPADGQTPESPTMRPTP